MALSENARGAVTMSLAMAAFTCNDAIVKSVSAELGTGQIMALRGLMATTIIFVVARLLGVRISLRAFLKPLLLLRTGLEIVATLTFIWALGRIDFAIASSIMQSIPLAVTLGAAVFLGEKVGWRRWLVIAAGFLGVLLIVRPGPEGFTAAALVAVISVFFTAARDVTTRRLARDTPSLMVSFFTSITVTLVGLALIPLEGGWQPVSTSVFIRLVFAALAIFTGYQTVILSMRAGDISFIAAFRYTGLLWALALSLVVFGETPDPLMLIGAGVVLATGLYSFHLERRRAETAGREG